MDCFRRSMNTKEKMENVDPQKFNWEMCQFPRNNFSTPVSHVEAYLNFVFAVDQSGQLTLFLISEELQDIDSDDSDDERAKFTLETMQFEGEPLFLKFFSEDKKLTLATTKHITTLEVTQTGSDTFTLNQ